MADLQDLAAVVSLVMEEHRYEEHFGSVFIQPETAEQTRRVAARALSRNPSWIWLAERRGRPVGLVWVSPPHRARWVAPLVNAAPAAPVVSHDNWDKDGSFTATADLWWGTNATSYRFELDGVVVGSGELAARTPNAQRATVALTGVAPGKHTLVAVFANANDETASKPVTVEVR